MLQMIRGEDRKHLLDSAPLIGGLFGFAAVCGVMLALVIVLGISFT